MAVLDTADYDFIRQLVYDRSRIHLGPDKVQLVCSRLHQRLRSLRLDHFRAYLDLLRSPAGADEVTGLLDALSTNVTDFFREPDHFEFLRARVLPEWLGTARRPPVQVFRVWSAACSSGEEAFSLAITLAEAARQGPAFQWEIVASDLSTRMLAQARTGIYRAERVRCPQPEWLGRYFERGTRRQEGFVRVKRELQSRVLFQHLNLTQWPYPFRERFQVVFCRNVMIYFDRATQEQLVPRLRQVLSPPGHLFVGHSESLLGLDAALRVVQPSIYRLA